MATKKVEEQSLATREDVAVTTNAIPDWMQEDVNTLPSNLGLEAIGSGDMTMPRLAIAQKTTQQAEEDNPLYITGLKPGLFFNTLTREIYGKGPLSVTPLFARQHRIKYGPRGTKQIDCRSENAIDGGRLSKLCKTCEYSQFGYDNGKTVKPSCTLYWTYIVAIHLPNRKFMPVAISLKSKMLKAAMDWNGFMRMRNAPAFTGVYSLESFLDKAGDNSFYNLKIDNQGIIADREKYEDGKNLFEALRGKLDKIKIHDEDVEEEERGDDSEVPF